MLTRTASPVRAVDRLVAASFPALDEDREQAVQKRGRCQGVTKKQGPCGAQNAWHRA